MSNTRDYSRIRYNGNPYRDREVVAIRGNSLYTVVVGEGYTEWNGNPTSYFNGHIKWTDAEARSRLFGGHLASINSEDEDIFVWNAFQSFSWIGYTDAKVEEDWRWSDGSKSTYNNFANRNTPDEDYAAYWDASPGNWHDCFDFGDAIRGGIAEIPLTSSITFSTAPKEGAGVFTTSINLSAGTASSGNLAEGATVYWKITGITADDLASGQLSGSGTISSGKLDLQHSLKRDSDTAESFEVSVFSDAEMTQRIGSTASGAVHEGPKVVARGNSIYTIVDGPSWMQAEANSVKLGGHLVTVNDESENSWISQQYAAFGQKFDGAEKWLLNAWIGFSDAETEGTWKWSSGQDVTFTGWGPGEPSSIYSLPDGVAYELTDRTEDFAHLILPASSGYRSDYGVYWNDTYNRAHMLYGGTIPEINGIAEIPFIQRGDSAYVIVQGPTWEEAEANAQALGGHLVTINDAEENNWIKDNLLRSRNLWIGATDRDQEGVWKWVDGTLFIYNEWDSDTKGGGNQPDNWGGDENFAQLVGWRQGAWNDIASPSPGGINEVFYGIAEIKLSDLGLDTTFYRSDTTPPTLQSTTATSNQLILTFSEDIQIAGGGSLNPAYMTVTVDGQTRKITRSQITAPDHPSIHTASKLALTLSGRSLDRASTISISYNPPSNGTSSGFITDLTGNKLAAITSQAVDTYSSSTNISKSGIANAYKNLILTGTAPTTGYGNAQDNTITGNDANNILDGLAGADTMLGGLGDDTYVVDNIGDQITELASAGIDTVQSSISYTLADNLENLTLLGSGAINGTGNTANNILTGNASANILNGNGGADTLIGGRGNDTYIVDSADDSITETGTSSDVDSVQASVSWTLGSNLENLTLTGTSAINGTGNERDNAISGNSANNILDGGNGGTDRLTGLGGADMFRFSTRPTSFRDFSADHITDFSSAQGDKIQISKSAFGISASTATLSVVSGEAALNTALSTASLFVYNTANGELHWNQNGITRGAGAGGVLAILDNRATLSAGDLMLV